MTNEPDPKDVAVAELLDDGHLEIDLTDPPTRAELAVPDGRKTFIIEDEGKEPFRVTVTFSDGHVLEADGASFVSVETDGASDPTRLVIGVLGLTLEEMTTLLRRDAEQFGIEEGRLNSFLRDAAAAEEGDPFTRSNFQAKGIAAPEFLEVTGILDGTAADSQVNYIVEWKK